MTRGLVIGKFMPIHAGHIALIRFAASHCEEVIVSMSYTPKDPIDADRRFAWLIDIFKDDLKVKPAMVIDDFDDESEPLAERTRIWSQFIQRRYPRIDVIFSSENYGAPFAAHMAAQHVSFDQPRLNFPVASSLIRANPFKYWEFIPEPVRPFYVKKVCIYGAESTGKSTIVKYLASKYQTEFVPEVARELITSNDFSVEDIIRIGIAHDKRVHEKSRLANKVLFCDTDVITTQIYSRHYLGVVPDILYEIERNTTYALYLLLDIDVPWVADGLRDLGEQRHEMMNVFRAELTKRNIDYKLIGGPFEEREQTICEAVDNLLH